MALVIYTKYLPATSTKGTRIQASTTVDGRKHRLAVAYDHTQGSQQWEHVALALARKVYDAEGAGVVPYAWTSERDGACLGVTIVTGRIGTDRSTDPRRCGVTAWYEEGIIAGRRLEREEQERLELARREREDGFFAQEALT